MKTPILALSCLLCILLCNPIYALDHSVCEITSFVADYVDNSCEGEIILIEFDFNAIEFGVNGFTVEANGDIYAYNIGDDYEIYMITLCDQVIELVITDNDDPNCTEVIILEPACCECEIDEPVITTSACDDGQFDLFIDFFNYQGTCGNYDWFITLNGVDYPLEWNSSTQQLESFGLTGADEELTIELCNDSPLEECFTYIIEGPCFSTCSIDSFFAEYDESGCTGEIIPIYFEFTGIDFGINGFEVSTNGNTQFYNIGDDYILYELSDCTDEVLVTITDVDDPNCTASYLLEPACCACAIEEPTITTSECENGQFDIFIDFFIAEGTCIFYEWYLTLNGIEYPLVYNDISQQYEAFGLIGDDEELTIELCNDSPLEECFTYIIEGPCFSACSIDSFVAEYDENSCVGEIITVYFEFTGTDFGDNGFEISYNGNSQFYNLGDDYSFFALSDCDEDVILTIMDFDDPNCFATFNLGPACCDCEILDPVIETTECDNGTFDLTIEDFLLTGSCLNYDWFVTIEGNDYDLVWNGDSYEAINIVAAGSQFTLMLCNDGPLNECFSFLVDNPCFEPLSNCLINDFFVQYIDGSCEGELIFFEFEFDAVDFGVNGFQVFANGDSQTYSLGDDYIFAIISECNQDIIVTIVDADDPSCQAGFNLGPACCDCEIEEPTFETSACDMGGFDLFVDFFLSEGTCVSYSWFISYLGVDFDLTWNASTLQYEAYNFMSSDSLVTFNLCNDSPLMECWAYQIVNPCFDSGGGDCVLSSFEAEFDTSSCDGEIININFDFDGMGFGANGFEVMANGFSQFYNLGDDYIFFAITLCTDDIIISITDADDPTCGTSINLGPACCDCEIDQPSIDVSACTNNSFNIFIDYFDVSGTCVGYEWFLTFEGNDYDLIWNSNNQNYEVLSLMASDSVVSVMLCNDSPLNECWPYEIINPCYENTVECNINSFNAEYISCDGEIIFIEFEFDATDFGTNGFLIEASNGDSQFYNLGDDYLFAIIAACTDDINLTIADANEPNCQASIILNPACCDCGIEDPIFEISDCMNDNFDLFVSYFPVEGTCISYGWTITIDDISYELVFDGQNFLVVDIPSNSDAPIIELIICSDGPLNECYDFTIDNPCYVETEDCNIEPLFAIVSTAPCDSTGSVYIEIDFDIVDEGSLGYSVDIDGVTQGTYDYPPGMEILVESNCSGPIEVTVQDLEFPDCSATVLVDACCPDVISSVSIPNEKLISINYDFNGDIIISNLLELDLTMSLCSIDGKVIDIKTLYPTRDNIVSISDYPTGIYILTLLHPNGNTSNYKIMNVSR